MPPPYVVSLAGVRPAPRYSPLVTPWTIANFQEAESPDGPWVTVEVIDPLVPAATPLDDPPTYSFSTDAAQLESGWYRIVFEDALGNEGPSEAEAGSGTGVLLPPSPSVVRRRSQLVAASYPEDPLDADVEDRLREDVRDATALVESLTCRKLDAALAADEGLARLALRAVTLKTEKISGRSSVSAAGAMSQPLLIKSISAGPWSESYFGPEEAAKAKMLDSDPALHEVLWALATEECRDRWLELWSGVNRPAGQTTEIAWGAASGLGRTPWWLQGY